MAARVATLEHGTNRFTKVEVQNCTSTLAEAGEQLKVGRTSVANAKRLLKDGHPDIIEEVEAGNLILAWHLAQDVMEHCIMAIKREE